MGDGGVSVVVELGTRTSAATLDRDWVLPHEMAHLFMPSVARTYHWIEEGFAVYFEPIARARMGQISPEEVWRTFAGEMPMGLPTHPGDQLDGSDDWRRTYWGGALFCLLADLEIRRRTGGQLGLDDAVRGILSEGGSVAEIWPFDRLLDTGDSAVGSHVLRELHRDFGLGAWNVDVVRLFRDLGVRLDGDHVRLVDDAPLSAYRRAITGQAVDAVQAGASGRVPPDGLGRNTTAGVRPTCRR
jgi:hypothetical protein